MVPFGFFGEPCIVLNVLPRAQKHKSIAAG
jgi:hypothetical protein